MVRIHVLTFCLASIFVLDFVNSEVENNLGSEITSVDFFAVEDIAQFLLENSDAELLEKVSNVPNTKNQIIYRLGSRISGDRLVAQGSDNQQWSTQRDVTTTLTYPRTGTGNIVSYVQINVDQSSNLGRAYVVAGGIGQRIIKIIVEAKQTFYFRHNTVIYGY